jgi:hypothetical protein
MTITIVTSEELVEPFISESNGGISVFIAFTEPNIWTQSRQPLEDEWTGMGRQRVLIKLIVV